MSLIYMGGSPGRLKACREHRHDHYELILNAEGAGTAYTEGEAYPFCRGTLQIIPPGVLHHKESAQGFKDLYFCFDDARGPWEKICENRVAVFSSDDADRTLENLLCSMLSRYISGRRDSVLDGMYRLALLLAAERFAPERRDTAVEYVEQKLRAAFNDPELDVTAVLSSTGYDKDHIRRRFKSKTGVTPLAYVENLRMNHARHLLSLNGGLRLTLGEIAEMCGYYDSRYFSRVFKKTTGVTPGRFR